MTVRQLKEEINKISNETLLDTEIEAIVFGEDERYEELSLDHTSFGCIQRKNLFKPIAELTLVKKEENIVLDSNIVEEEK